MSEARWRRLRWVGFAALVLSALDIASFELFARRRVLQALPEMARWDLEFEYGGEHRSPPHRVWTLMREESQELDPGQLADLRDVFRSFGITLLLENELRPPQQLVPYVPMEPHRREECVECHLFAFGVVTSRLGYVVVQTDIFQSSGGESFFRHRRIWLFGWWIPLGDRLVAIT